MTSTDVTPAHCARKQKLTLPEPPAGAGQGFGDTWLFAMAHVSAIGFVAPSVIEPPSLLPVSPLVTMSFETSPPPSVPSPGLLEQWIKATHKTKRFMTDTGVSNKNQTIRFHRECSVRIARTFDRIDQRPDRRDRVTTSGTAQNRAKLRGSRLAHAVPAMNARTIWVGCAFASTLVACFLSGGPNGEAGGDSGADSGDSGTVLPFQADPPTVYVPKVKYILTSLAATDAEVKQVEQDPTSFVAMVDGWMQLLQYQTKMLKFFALAFQQTQIGSGDFVFQIPNGPGGIGQMAQTPSSSSRTCRRASRAPRIRARGHRGAALHRRLHDDDVHDDAAAARALWLHG